VSHPTGSTFVRALLSELDQQNRLKKYFTSIGTSQESHFISKLLGKRRSYRLNSNKLSTQFFPEILRLLPFGAKSQESRRQAVDSSYQSLDNRVSESLAMLKGDIIHAYEDGAARSFVRAKELGVFCSYELPIAHWSMVRRLLAEEAERLPEWEPTLESTREPEEKLVRKDEELSLADCISCPSEFVLQSIPAKIRKKTPCQIAPFGSPADTGNTLPRNTSRKNGKLKLLFVGSMSQRKGLADLFEAMKLVDSPQVTLTILGRPSMPMHFYRSHYPNFKYLPPRSNEGVREVMLEHDVLVLPSIIEGRALVQQEALACGLPLIVTQNTGGEDLIEEERTGFIVPIRKPDAIAEKIDWFCQNLQEIDEMSEYCRNKASQYKWSEYARSIINFCLRIRSNSADI
ncbi:MAG: glycosyltransferase, partial [Opitutae bacterium]|nr:glycosyltransferase [Opitutae bacterium]